MLNMNMDVGSSIDDGSFTGNIDDHTDLHVTDEQDQEEDLSLDIPCFCQWDQNDCLEHNISMNEVKMKFPCGNNYISQGLIKLAVKGVELSCVRTHNAKLKDGTISETKKCGGVLICSIYECKGVKRPVVRNPREFEASLTGKNCPIADCPGILIHQKCDVKCYYKFPNGRRNEIECLVQWKGCHHHALPPRTGKQIEQSLKSTILPMPRNYIRRLIAAPPTFFNENGKLPLELELKRQIGLQASWLIEGGVNAVFVTGTNAECMALSVYERSMIARVWAEVCFMKEMKMIWHIGCASLQDTCTLAQDAHQGVGWVMKPTAIATTPPLYHKTAGVHEIVLSLSEVAKHAPSLPLYYYHYPAMTHCDFLLGDILEDANKSKLVPTLVGAKFTSTDLSDLGRSSKLADSRYDILLGTDDMILGGFAQGAVGYVSTLANIPTWAKYLVEVVYVASSDRMGDVRSVDHAQKLQVMLNFINRSSEKYTANHIAFIKGIMAQLCINRCIHHGLNATMRLPMRTADPSSILKFLRELEKENGFAKFK